MSDKKEAKESKEEYVEIPGLSKMFSGVGKNAWFYVSIILIVIFIVWLALSKSSSGSNSGSSTSVEVSSTVAAQNLLTFIQGQTGIAATFVSSSEVGGLYQIVVSYQGKQVPVYVTKDGKSIVSQPIPMVVTNVSSASVSSTPKNSSY